MGAYRLGRYIWAFFLCALLKNFGTLRKEDFIARPFGFFFIIKIGQDQKRTRRIAVIRQ